MVKIHHGLIKKLKSLIFEKITAFKMFRRDRNKIQLNIIQDLMITTTETFKQKYYCRMTNKLINTQKSSKAYWSLLKGFLNKKKMLSLRHFTKIYL